MGSVELSQTEFRGRNDDGNEADATWIAAANVIWEQPVDELFRLRFLIQRADQPATANGFMNVWVSHNGGSFEVCASDPGTSPIQDIVTANLTNESDSTQQLGSATYIVNNNCIVDGEGKDNTYSANFQWLANDVYEIEAEFALQIVGALVSPGDTLELRVRFLDAVLSSGYVEIPIFTVPAVVVAGVDNALKIKGDALLLKGSSLIIK